MKNIVYIILLFLFASVGNTGENSNPANNCNKVEIKKCDFTGDGISEEVRVSIKGKICKNATYKFSIITAKGEVLYKFSKPVSKIHTAIDNLITYPVIDEEMPKVNIMPHQSKIELITYYRSVSKAKYLELMSNKLPYFILPPGYEGATDYVVYDPSIGKFIKFGGI